MGLIIRSSAIHAAGCYATTPIRKGARVAEYTGPRLTKAQADVAYDEQPITYLFGLGDGSIVIDGHCMAMFINHSCDPNCETHEEKGRVWIKAIRKIEPGEEITYDYCLYDGDEDEAPATAAQENAAEPCIRVKKSAGASDWRKGQPFARPAPAARRRKPRRKE